MALAPEWDTNNADPEDDEFDEYDDIIDDGCWECGAPDCYGECEDDL